VRRTAVVGDGDILTTEFTTRRLDVTSLMCLFISSAKCNLCRSVRKRGDDERSAERTAAESTDETRIDEGKWGRRQGIRALHTSCRRDVRNTVMKSKNRYISGQYIPDSISFFRQLGHIQVLNSLLMLETGDGNPTVPSSVKSVKRTFHA